MIMNRNYRLELIDQIDNPEDDNVDVAVQFENGQRYIASFFTLKNVQTILSRHKSSGESAYGKYFWASDAIIVERLDLETIRTTIADLLDRDHFEQAFDGPHPPG